MVPLAVMKDAGSVKEALRCGTASPATAEALQCLLGETTSSQPTGTAKSATNRKPAESKGPAPRSTGKPFTAKTTTSQSVHIAEDPSPILTGREKYALATETVNITLKVLSEAVKAQHRSARKPSIDDENVPQKPLQQRSGNATPIKSPPTEAKAGRRRSSTKTSKAVTPASTHLAAVAECAHSAFSFLRSADPQKLGVKALPRCQLENGMLALASRLTSFGMTALAVGELRSVRRSLEASLRATKKATRDPAHKETIASMLHFEVDFDSDPDALSVAVNYSLHVLNVISSSRKAAMIQNAAKYLAFDQRNSPVNLILQQHDQSGDYKAAAKQLESLSQTIFSLCPSISSTSDEVARDQTRSPSPSTVLDLQVLALRIRKLWWELANHEVNVPKELLEPFLACAKSFIRRNDRLGENFSSLARSFDTLGMNDYDCTDGTMFDIQHLLCFHAEMEGKHEQAMNWAGHIVQGCSSLEFNHAKRLASAVIWTTINVGSGKDADTAFDSIVEGLQSNLTGYSVDFDILLTALASLVRVSCSRKLVLDVGSSDQIPGLAAAFAIRYSRSYSEKNIHIVREILSAALRLSKSASDIVAWVSDDTAKVFIQAGALTDVAEATSSQPLSAAWRVHTAAISLSHVLHALVLRTLRNPTDCLIFHDERLPIVEQGIVVELQLKHATELAPKFKYRDALRRILPDLLGRLSKCYPPTQFPIRRARVAIAALQLHETVPGLLAPHHFQIWLNDFPIEEENLADDAGLERYCGDTKATLDVTRAFSRGRPTVDELKSSLIHWQCTVNLCGSKVALCDRLEDPVALIRLLGAVVAYFRMLGDGITSLRVQRILTKLAELCAEDFSTVCTALVALAEQYSELGYSDRAGQYLERAYIISEVEHISTQANLRLKLAYVDHLLAVETADACHRALEKLQALCSEYRPSIVTREDKSSYELCHAQSWLIQSKHSFLLGSPHEALRSAKRSVRVLNSIWTSFERSHGNKKPDLSLECGETAAPEVDSLTKGVSKLKLSPKETSSATKQSSLEVNKKGAAFWQIVPLLCRSLKYLSDMYAHHGLYTESNYYSERAMQVAESGGSSMLLSSIRSHRIQLLVHADRIQEAELCLEKDGDTHGQEPSLTNVDQLLAQATLREKEDAFEEARSLYEKAGLVVDELSSEVRLTKIDSFDNRVESIEKRTALVSLAEEQPPCVASAKIRATIRHPINLDAGPVPKHKPRKTKSTSISPAEPSNDKPLAGLRAEVLLRKALLDARSGLDAGNALAHLAKSPQSQGDLVKSRHAQYLAAMQAASSALELDVTLNVLTESTLAFPAMVETTTPPESVSSKPRPVGRAVPAVKPSKKKPGAAAKVANLLNIATDALCAGNPARLQSASTVQIHNDCAMLSDVSLLLSAISAPQSPPLHFPLGEGLMVDLPRIKANQYEQQAVVVGDSPSGDSELLTWPSSNDQPSSKAMTAAEFHADFVEILPQSWTAVSICLSENASDLYVARYRSGQRALTLKLPFSRHKPDGLDESPFNYHAGKAELREIIDLSNYSCHSSGDMDRKGAKTNWWSEREALDRRLHELLVNIEDIWFGGFKGILSPQQTHEGLLLQFRRSFEDILIRYIPSRAALKGQRPKLVPDDKVLELFIGLGSDRDGMIDLEEPIADLLYFVVDMMQFAGERNAYDEIDFDGMAVDVLDALRAYHEACADRAPESQHLILILDRRLQAFPWESLSCLESVNVSRVGSMLSLRERILTLRSAWDGKSKQGLPNGGEHCPIVPRTSGTYILNPSSDLPGTQAILAPALSTLSNAAGTNWTGIINAAPTEASFTTALTSSSTLLYFGHGGGSQYIRTRTIKRLSRCSEVVWLMGCSSGAVAEYGDLEPSAIPLSYLQAGESSNSEDNIRNHKCMAVLATLWDVTDKDIDRFSLAVGEDWGLWPGSAQSKLPMKTPKKKPRQIVAAPSTPHQVPKTPKTPKVLKTPAAKTPARSRSQPRSGEGRKRSLVEAVSRSRDACYLRYLNGAAPVVYGVPVYLGD